MTESAAHLWTTTAEAVHQAAQAWFGAELAATVVHGSATLGGWAPGASDLDLLLVCGTAIEHPHLDGFAGDVVGIAATHALTIELSVITHDLASAPRPPWPFLLHVNAPAGFASSPRVVFDNGTGDPDLLMHIAVCREHGLAVGTPHPDDKVEGLFGDPGRTPVLQYLRAELEWGLREAAQKYAVLNACRALRYVDDAAIVSKVNGGRWAVEHLPAYADLVSQAIEEQGRGLPSPPPGREAACLVQEVLAAIDRALCTIEP